MDDLLTSVLRLDRDNLNVIFDLHNKLFEGGSAGDGRFYPCVVCGIVTFVHLSVLYFEMSYDVDGRPIGV